jgi:lipid II:glycine glycyltransferase (peptidoglycan interpeptide bridge formation enzyme)
MFQAYFVKESEYTALFDSINKNIRVMYTQYPEYGRMKASLGNKVKYIIVKDNEKNTAVAFAQPIYIPVKKILFRVEIAYGPVVDKRYYGSYGEIIKAIKDLVMKDIRVREFRMNPMVEKNSYRNLELKEKDINSEVEKKLLEAGMERINAEFYEDISLQGRFFYELDIKGKSSEEIKKNVVPSLRNRMRKAEKEGLLLHMLDPGEYDLFFDMLESTYERIDTNQEVRREFCLALKEYFGDRVFFPLVYMDCNHTLEEYGKQKANLEKELAEVGEKYKNPKKIEGKKRELNEALASLEKSFERVRLIKEENGNLISIYSGFFIMTEREMIYIFGAGYDEYFHLNGAPAMHSHMIDLAAKNQCNTYNLFSITGIFTEDAPDYGVLKFKETFNGNVKEYIGTYHCKK